MFLPEAVTVAPHSPADRAPAAWPPGAAWPAAGGDTGKFREALTTRADEFTKIADRARTAGALHHRFGVGPGYVVVVDEWESTQDFEKFFGDPDMQAFIGSVGADPAPPEMIISEAVSSPDQY